MLKKLIFLLKYMMKNNKILDNNSVSSFIDEAINQNVSPNLISYLYNYLYILLFLFPLYYLFLLILQSHNHLIFS